MWVRIRAAHGRALVLEDLHVPQLLFGLLDLVLGRGLFLQKGELGSYSGEGAGRGKVGGVDARPCLDNGQNFGGAHVGKSGRMLGAEGQNVALARDGLSAKKEGGEIIGAGRLRRMVLGLLFFDGAVVVDEDEGVLVLGIGFALRPWVSGT